MRCVTRGDELVFWVNSQIQLRYFVREAQIDSGCMFMTVRIVGGWLGSSLGCDSCWNIATQNAVMTTSFGGLEPLVLWFS